MLFSFWVHKCNENKFFVSKEQFPQNTLFLDRYKILSSKMYRNSDKIDYDNKIIEIMCLYGIENVRSDEEPNKEISSSKYEQYLWETNYFKKKNKQIDCKKCGLEGHFDIVCEEEFNILGHYIGSYEGSDDEEYEIDDDDDDDDDEK